jgi:hypothetical protein
MKRKREILIEEQYQAMKDGLNQKRRVLNLPKKESSIPKASKKIKYLAL